MPSIEVTVPPGLGDLRRRQSNSSNTGWKNASFQGYADYMLTPEFERNLHELLERAHEERVALMCAESASRLPAQASALAMSRNSSSANSRIRCANACASASLAAESEKWVDDAMKNFSENPRLINSLLGENCCNHPFEEIR